MASVDIGSLPEAVARIEGETEFEAVGHWPDDDLFGLLQGSRPAASVRTSMSRVALNGNAGIERVGWRGCGGAKSFIESPWSFCKSYAATINRPTFQFTFIAYRAGGPFARGDDVARIKQHLIRLGYHPARDGAELVSAGSDLYGEEMTRAVGLFQAYFRLPVTGEIGQRTMELLNAPRCGVRDIPEGVDLRALSETISNSGSEADDPFTFRFNSGPWETYDLRYHVYNGSPDLTSEVECVDAAFKIWADASPLRFTRVATAADANIHLGFEAGAHGDGSPTTRCPRRTFAAS